MGKCPYWIVLLLVLVACTSDPNVAVGPRLVQEVTLEPTAIMPTRSLSPTPSPIAIPVVASEQVAATATAGTPGFVLVTATLPPSKTPTPTATITPTFTATIPPTISQIVLVTQPYPFYSGPSANQGGPPCPANWFFAQPVVSVCPLSNALVSAAAYQPFQQGVMIWIQSQDAIYSVYDGATLPRWEVFRDTYVEGAPEEDMSSSAPPFTWQPRRGFGEVWRNHPDVRQRLGWAISEKEEPYTAQVQIAADGTIFLAEPRGGIISLQAGGQSWGRYAAP